MSTVGGSLDTAGRNLKYAALSLAKSPGFSLITVMILAAGIGFNVRAFSLVDALVFRSLPVERPEELVRISSIDNQWRLGQLPSTILAPLGRDPLQGLCGFDTAYEGAEVNGTLSSVGVEGLTG
ncbi:MAG: hypothetical protein ACRD9L_07950, partial [Bryobacteraceae bacterium]